MTHQDTIPHIDVAIIGAGIGGLTLALALRERGIEATLLERTAELREVGAAVALSANATTLYRRFGLYDALGEVSWAQTDLVFRDGRSGATLARTPVGATYRERFGADYWGIHRAELQRILSSAVGAEHIRLSHKVTGLREEDDRVLIDLADGRQLSAGVVVGADGARSMVRRWIVGHDDAIYSGRSGFRGIVATERLTQLPDPRAIQFWTGPTGHLLHYAIGARGEDVNFLAVTRTPARWTAPEWVVPAEDREKFAAFEGWHPAVTEMIGAVEVGQRWALMRRPPLRTWHRGRVVLLGDAAHSLVPHHGQGANQSIEDTYVLAEELARADLHDPVPAFEAYEARRRLRTRGVQYASWQVAKALHVSDGAEAEARNAAMAEEDFLEDKLAWIHGYDATVDSGLRPGSVGAMAR
ncbi:FAD-dependent monooxygenase [Raineyella fluvialis]|uniref:NAD(P)-binding protein n=1 Tax=Raineyella fluvialis TaxID=2662261 RepID=A0A5Q2F8P2_9ACTN|nr:FAD-dependent monooxygenase [Raineyella fluvialis]QGF23199.1 NAD(P)-binding protein [Raineyella fluvialis]